MKAVLVESFSQLPAIGEIAEPEARNGEVVVQPIAAAIKPIDRAIASGKHYSSPRVLPIVCGLDGVGYDPAGRLVYFMTTRRPFGAMAELAPAAWTVPVPPSLHPSTAAAVVNPAIAAWLPLQWRGSLKIGETVLVMGATGAAGRMTIKAARHLGAGRIIAAGRRMDELAALNADAIVDLKLPPTELRAAFINAIAGGLHVIVDFLWGPPIEDLLDSLMSTDLDTAKDDAPIRLVSVGQMAGPSINLSSEVLRSSRLQIVGSGTSNMPPSDQMCAMTASILALAAKGELTMPTRDFAFADATEAWRAARAADGTDRPVLRMSR